MNDDPYIFAENAVRILSDTDRVVFAEPGDLRAAIDTAIYKCEKRHVITTHGGSEQARELYRNLEREGIGVTRLSMIDQNGGLEAEHLQIALQIPSAAVCVPFADAETGLIFPVEQIAAAVKENSDALLLIDTSGTKELLDTRSVAELRGRLERTILRNVPRSRLNTTDDPRKRLPHITNISFENTNGESIAAMLSERGFNVTTGSACADKAHEPSAMLRSLNIPYSFAMGSIRIELSTDCDDDKITRFADETARIVGKLRSYG